MTGQRYGTGPATLTISLDVEMGWGAVEGGRWRERQERGVYRGDRRATAALLREMDSLEIPATWAVVGGLLERPGRHDLSHLPTSARATLSEALRLGDQPTFHAPDVVEAILAARTPHELACHTYSHTRLSHPGVDEQFLQTDLDRFARVFPEEAGAFRSLVFPGNEAGFLEQAAASGVYVYRGPVPRPANSRAAQLATSVLRGAPLAAVEKAQVSPGLLRAEASLLFTTRPGQPYALPYLYRKATRGLQRAVRAGGLLHVYAHPYNFALSWGVLEAFVAFLRRAARLRDAGLLRVRTMRDLRSA